jgi:hypothetical protein
MRRALPLVVAIALVVASAWFALTLPPPGAGGSVEPRVMRVFIPAIKTECRDRAGIESGADIGYTFTTEGALATIDRDGRFTGVDPVQLAALNACLGLYPIKPIAWVPRDHYTRNLLYDYQAGVLQPCLSARADGLPPLPARADFVVRLYRWDPFRTLAAEHPLDELLALSAACPEFPPYLDPIPRQRAAD